MTRRTCALCGTTTGSIRIGLIEYDHDAEQTFGRRFASLLRCDDRIACRCRVERVLGEPWGSNDGTPAPVGAPT